MQIGIKSSENKTALKTFYVKISDNTYTYGHYALKKRKVKECPEKTCNRTQKQIDCVFLHYLIKELKLSDYYRISYIYYNLRSYEGVIFVLNPTKIDLIDYNWNFRVTCMVREQCELEHALSWLSTLGGAFSALGDYFSNCAETAGKISFHQLKLAMRLGDPNIASRCLLYYALSLIQQRRFRKAKSLIEKQYEKACSGVVNDSRLVKMCKGIWSKLQHEYNLYKNKQYKDKIVNKSVKFLLIFFFSLVDYKA